MGGCGVQSRAELTGPFQRAQEVGSLSVLCTEPTGPREAFLGWDTCTHSKKPPRWRWPGDSPKWQRSRLGLFPWQVLLKGRRQGGSEEKPCYSVVHTCTNAHTCAFTSYILPYIFIIIQHMRIFDLILAGYRSSLLGNPIAFCLLHPSCLLP